MNLDLEISSIIKTLSIKANDNPFVGLRSFEADEGHLFFGRDAQIKELLKKLDHSHFLAVIGSSGCGKSSLIRAGLIPKLKGGFLAQKRDHWLIATMRPSGSPLQYFASSLHDCIKDADESPVKSFFNQLSPDYLFKLGAADFVNQLKSHFIHNRFNLFILVDQFEELFTYKTNSENQKNENIFFINLLLSLANEPDLPVYTVITMRSDYIGHCNRFFGLPELLNESQYLVPRLKWQQVREVIEFPAKLYGNEINAGLLDLLTNDSDKDLDQLPILQHCLMRTYDNWIADGSNGYIDFRHYEKTGKLEGAICKHANEIFNTLDDKQKKITEYLFKAITEFNADYEPVRKPKKFEVIVKICEAVENASREDVRKVVNVFRKKSCAFLTPSEGVTDITDDTIIDVSHESLLRQWDLLKDDKLKGAAKDGWMAEEQRSADKLYWLSELAKAEHKEYLGKLGIADAEKWRKKQNPNVAWAERYIHNFRDIETFVAKSKIKTRTKDFIFKGSISLSIIALILLIFFTAESRVQVEKSRVQAANSKATQAEIQRKTDSLLLQAADAKTRRQTDSLLLQATKAETQRQKDLLLIQAANAEADRQKAAAQLQVAKVEALKKHISDSILTTSADSIVNLASSQFYKSNHFSSAEKRNCIDSLIKYKYINFDTVRYSNLLGALNTKGRIYLIAESNPNKAFLEAIKVSKNPGDTLGRSIAYDLANNYFFYTQDTVLSKRAAYRRLVAISKNGNLLAIKLDDTIKIFTIENDALLPSQKRNIVLNSSNRSDSAAYYVESDDSKNSMAFIKEDSLVTFVKDGVYEINTLTGQFIRTPLISLNKINHNSLGNSYDYNRYYVSSISPDGKKIGIDSGDYYIKILNKNSNNTLKALKTNSAFGYVNGIDFSYDNNVIIGKQNTHCTVFFKSPDTDFFSKKDYTYASFTPDKQYLIVQPEGTSSVFELHDLEHDSTISRINFAEYNIDTFKNSIVTSITLSSDWKKLFITTKKISEYAYRTYYFQRNNIDSIFPFIKVSNTGVQLIPTSYISSIYASNVFLNNNNLISFNDSAWIWEKFEGINSDVQLNQLAEKISFVASFDSALISHLQKDHLSYLKMQYEAMKAQYENMTDSNPGAYLPQYRLYSNICFTYYPDTAERIRDLKKITFHEEKLLKTNFSDTILKHNLSSDYWNLSWFLVFRKSFDSVINSARRGFELYPANSGINTNLALGYLLRNSKGDCEKADSVYTKYKDKSYLSDKRNFTSEFLNDLDNLEYAGVITQNEQKIYNHVEAVRKFLKGEINVLNCNTP